MAKSPRFTITVTDNEKQKEFTFGHDDINELFKIYAPTKNEKKARITLLEKAVRRGAELLEKA